MNRSKKEPFEVFTYAGSELGEFSADGERPPRTAKLVAEIGWSWSPMHSAQLRYLICTDEERTAWTLWAVARNFDDVRRVYARIASGSPFRGYIAKCAAEQLLIAGWRSEVEMGGTVSRGANVVQEGLLSQQDIERIEQEVFDSPGDRVLFGKWSGTEVKIDGEELLIM